MEHHSPEILPLCLVLSWHIFGEGLPLHYSDVEYWPLSPHGALFQASGVLNLCSDRITTRLTTCPHRCHSACAARNTIHSNWLLRPLCMWYKGLLQAASHLSITGCRCETCRVHHSGGAREGPGVARLDNAWRDDGDMVMRKQLVALMDEAGVRPAYTQHLSPQGHPRGDPNDSTSSTVAQGHGTLVLSAHDHPRSHSNDPTLSSSTRGHVLLVGAQSMGSYAMLAPGWVVSPQGPPRGAPNDSTASATTQGHGAPLHRPQDCPVGESLCIASMVSPTGVLTP